MAFVFVLAVEKAANATASKAPHRVAIGMASRKDHVGISLTPASAEKIAGNIAHGLVVGASAEILQRPSAAAVFWDLIWARGAPGKFVWPK